MKDNTNAEDVSRKRSRHEWQKAEELENLEEARKTVTTGASVDEEGSYEINPRSPRFIGTYPSYTAGESGTPSKRQRTRSKSTDSEAEREDQPIVYDVWQDGAIVPHIGAEEELGYESEDIVLHCCRETRNHLTGQWLRDGTAKPCNVDFFSNPTELEALKRAYAHERGELKDQDRGSIIDRSGSEPEKYVDDSESEQMIEESDKDRAMESESEEDIMANNRRVIRKTKREREIETIQRNRRRKQSSMKAERRRRKIERRELRILRIKERREKLETLHRLVTPRFTRTQRISSYYPTLTLQRNFTHNIFPNSLNEWPSEPNRDRRPILVERSQRDKRNFQG